MTELSEVTFESLERGHSYGRFDERVTRETCDALRGQLGTTRPGTVAPTGLYPVLFLRAFKRAMGGIPPGGILAKAGIEVRDELPVEADVTIEVLVADTFVKRGRPRARIEFVLRDEGDREIVRGHHTIVWATDEDRAREVRA